MKRLFSVYIRKRLHTKKIDQHYQHTFLDNEFFDKERNRVAIIQKTISPVKRLEEFLDSIYNTVNEAVKTKAMYVIFPEYIFFDLFGIIPFYRLLSKFLNKENEQTDENPSIHHSTSSENRLLRFIFDLFAEPTEKVILQMMKRLAKQFSIYIFTGSYLHKENGRLFNVGTLIDPNGNIVHTQRKVHLTDFEVAIGLSRGEEFNVVDLPIGKTATPICMDATYFETFQIVRRQGANIVMIPIANNEKYNKWKALRGIWPRVQESYVYGLKPALTGSIAGLKFTGKAGVFAPIEMTENNDGVVAISENSIGDEIVYANLNVEQLEIIRNVAQYQNDTNVLFEKDYVKKTY